MRKSDAVHKELDLEAVETQEEKELDVDLDLWLSEMLFAYWLDRENKESHRKKSN